MSSTVGRYAPSPSGRMHLGNLCCCLLAWLSAKSSGGKVVLRIEDLDAVRCPREFADLLEADLAWLGLAADEGGSKGGPRGPHKAAPPMERQFLEAVGQCYASRTVLIDHGFNILYSRGEITPFIDLPQGSPQMNLAQIDTPYLSATSSGLTYLTERFKDFPNGVHIALQGVPRSILAEYAESHL